MRYLGKIVEKDGFYDMIMNLRTSRHSDGEANQIYPPNTMRVGGSARSLAGLPSCSALLKASPLGE